MCVVCMCVKGGHHVCRVHVCVVSEWNACVQLDW
jgi:hypothetical protein